jgi:hypothetical protein
MNKQRKILLLRISFWLGAIIDLLAAVQLSVPSLWASMSGFTAYEPSGTLNFALYIAGSLMVGWTLLLVWADRKPLERKGILLITVFPVVIGLVLNNVLAVASGLRSLGSAVPELALQGILTALFTFSYLNARRETT